MRLFLIAIAAPHGAGDERLRYRVGATRLSGSAEPRHHAAQTLGLVRYRPIGRILAGDSWARLPGAR